jgi:hypothetical protein
VACGSPELIALLFFDCTFDATFDFDGFIGGYLSRITEEHLTHLFIIRGSPRWKAVVLARNVISAILFQDGTLAFDMFKEESKPWMTSNDSWVSSIGDHFDAIQHSGALQWLNAIGLRELKTRASRLRFNVV